MNQEHIYALDAGQSGYQMISIFLKNLQLAQISNLTGNTLYDIYSQLSNDVLDFIIKLTKPQSFLMFKNTVNASLIALR